MSDRMASVLWVVAGIAWGAAAVLRVGLLLGGDYASGVSLALLLGMVAFVALTPRKGRS